MELLQQLVTVGAVLALLGVALWFLKRQGGLLPALQRTAGRRLQVVERVALGPQHALALVSVDGKTMLVGTGPGVCEIRDVATES